MRPHARRRTDAVCGRCPRAAHGRGGAGADGHGTALHFLVADDQHEGDLFHLSFPDFVADLLAAGIYLSPEPGGLQSLAELGGVVMGAVGHGQDADLLRSDPDGEGAGVLLQQQGQGPLVAAHGGAMDDIGSLFLTVGIHIFHAELLGQKHIDLDGDEGVLLAVDVFDLDIEFRAVESRLINANAVGQADVVKDFLHGGLGDLPLLGGAFVLVAGVFGIPLGEAVGDVLRQAQAFQHVLGQLQAVAELILQLLGAENQVALRDGELPHADETVHLAGIFVAEQGRGFSQAHGQVPIGAGPVQKDLVLEGTGHGAEGKALLGFVVGVPHDEHAVQVVIPVAGDFIKLPLGHVGGFGAEIAPLVVLRVLHPALQELDDLGALGEQDGQALADDVHGGEIFQLAADDVVIPFFGLLQLGQMLLQLGGLGEGDAINPAELAVLRIGAPVSAGGSGELEGLDHREIHQVGASAEVGELALAVEGNVVALGGVLLNELDFIGLAPVLHELSGVGGGEGETLDGGLFLDDLLHLGFQGSQILRSEGLFHVKIVVEAAVDGRADGELCPRKKTLHGLGQQMGGGVPEGLFAVLVIEGQDFEGTVPVDDGAQILDLSVNPAGAGGAVKAHAQVFADIGCGNGSLIAFDAAVFQGNVHMNSSFLFKTIGLLGGSARRPG